MLIYQLYQDILHFFFPENVLCWYAQECLNGLPLPRGSFEQLTHLFTTANPGKEFAASFRERFDTEFPGEMAAQHQLVIVASELDAATERIVQYVSDFGVPINVVFFRYFVDKGREYIARSWLIDPAVAATRVQTRSSEAKSARR